MARYQAIIDVLVDDGRFERVYYDHETELPVPYRGIAYLRRNALQVQPGKGRRLHRKWADICAISNGKVKVILEEERKPTEDKVKRDIDIIAECKFSWTDGKLFPFDQECVLFILINNNVRGIAETVLRDVGHLKAVIVCDRESFGDRFAEFTRPTAR